MKQASAVRKIPFDGRGFNVPMLITNFCNAEEGMPEQMAPPTFSQTALELLLDDWDTVKCMIMSNVGNSSRPEQSGTALLDKFTYRLLAKCNPEVKI